MELSLILKDDCFKDASIISNHETLDQEVTSVMILEATDIENWGREGQLILTSYYALIDFSDAAMKAFFDKLKVIGIKGLVLKVDRLLSEAPKRLVDYCNEYDIPLIEIPKDVKYERIVLAVLQPIINENSKILNAYYDTRKIINRLSLRELSLSQLIKALKPLLGADVQFEDDRGKTFYSTLKRGRDYRVLTSERLELSEFVDNPYYEVRLKYPDGFETSAIRVEVPDVLDQKYSFFVFKEAERLNDRDYMFIENATDLLLTELLKVYAIKKSRSMRKNDLINDLLLGRYQSDEEMQSILSLLDIDHHDYYQGVIVSVYGEGLDDDNPIRTPVDPAIDFIQSRYKNVAFLQKNYDVIFLFNLKDPPRRLTDELLQGMLRRYNAIDYSHLTCHVGISSVYEKQVDGINNTLLSMKQFMRAVHERSHVLEYDRLGFFKMFSHVRNYEDLYAYVPKNVMSLAKDRPEYALTFLKFLNNNQHFVKTAEAMFIHPKTVRYRIEKMAERLGVRLEDTDTMLSIQVGLKICEYTGLLKF